MNALNFGSSIRQTDSTAINAKSSRSHAVFSLNLVQRRNKFQTNGVDKRHSMPIEAMTGQEVSVTTDSKLHFVDLAGSERLKNTGAQGERAKEGISINAGLASLGKVISQLSSRQSGSYVSYRDSKLTRLLQDSLGGNAITYMIACVTPAEFHLSETLNTVQYAQRARAIQSKPRIQQVEEGDKQAVIDRLKAEVSFLREQIRSAQDSASTPRGNNSSTNERIERDKEREAELQNQLLDMQENYSALSQRHARLIGELAKAGDKDSVDQSGEADAGSDATDRLNRSNSFAQAVEQVVLEYEKTIESLEQSLSSTRTTLSNTETTLLEKETKCAYVETINSQLQSRVQKLMDREANTENYLRDLETKLDGHTTGDEKNATIMIELRKEIARVRENEASCEDYISTLEERLAEADQDTELMQREIDRLEQLVERQRSLGKLDSLLYELDHVEESRPSEPEAVDAPISTARRNAKDHTRKISHMSRHSQIDEPILEADEHTDRASSRTSTVKDVFVHAAELQQGSSDRPVTPNGVVTDDTESVAQSPAQSRAVADKLETVTQELVDLRVEHESTVNQYDSLQAKYEEALRTVAQLQDVVDEARHPGQTARDSVISTSSVAETSQDRPTSFASEHAHTVGKDGPRSSASRSLSSELSSAMESSGTVDTSDDGVDALEALSEDDSATTKPTVSTDNLVSSQQHVELQAELDRLKALSEQRDAAEKELAERYAQLESEHSETLDMVEELKTDLSKARAVETSPRTSSPVIRRKSSQNLLIIDRAHRSFASLRNIASENFEEKPEVMQNFELNLNAAMHELHSRSERIQELEASVASAKKEMETKMTIISGLTRERTSLKASPMDITMLTTMREKLEHHEKSLNDMRAAHDKREQELLTELESLRNSAAAAESQVSREVAPNKDDQKTVQLSASTEEHERQIASLQSELAAWEGKHQTTLDYMGSVEQDLRRNIAQLEEELTSSKAALSDRTVPTRNTGDEAIKELESKHQKLVAFLRDEIDEYKALIHTNTNKVAELEKNHDAARSELVLMAKSREEAITEAARHQTLVADLQSKLASFEETSKSHSDSLGELKSAHAKELRDLKAQEQKSYEEQVEVLLTEHADAVRKLETEVTDARDDLMKVATQVAFALGLDVSIEKLTERIDGLVGDQRALAEEQKKGAEMKGHLDELTVINEKIMTDLEEAKAALTELVVESDSGATPATIKEHIVGVKNKMLDLEGRNKKHSRLVEELEEQLQNNFDEAQMTNKRLSTLQTERAAQLDEANAARVKLQSDLDTIREEYNSLQSKLHEAGATNGDVQRSNSNSTIRKSASHNSLPSPPPAIPLPPLPATASAASSINGVPMSPTGARPMSRDTINMSQITEDQEARIRTIEKHLYAERQLTQTLEEALSDLEKQSKKVKSDCDAWRKRAADLESEVRELKERPAQESQQDNRWSMLQVEEERKKRQAAEAARKQLEERMNAINKGKKKKGSLNCF